MAARSKDATVQASTGGSGEKSALRRFFSFDNISLLFILIALIVIFGLLTPDTFLTWGTFRTVLAAQAITAIMALAILMPVAAGQFDLSIGGSMGFSIVLIVVLMVKGGLPPLLAAGITIVVAVVIGLVNGFVVVKWKVNSFITTLATGTILLSLIQWVSEGKQISSGIPEEFLAFARAEILFVPAPVIYMLLIAAIMWYFLESRQTGRYMYAIGSNKDAARLAGVKVGKLTMISLVVSATVAAIAGIIFASRIGSASLDAGSSYMLPAFAAVFLGATQFKAGNVNVLGTLVAVYVLAVGIKGMQLIGAPFWVDGIFNGVALIIAVALAVRSGRQRALI